MNLVSLHYVIFISCKTLIKQNYKSYDTLSECVSFDPIPGKRLSLTCLSCSELGNKFNSIYKSNLQITVSFIVE